MSRKAAGFALALVITLATAFVAGAAQPQTNAANDAVDYILALQNDDGGFPSFGSNSDMSGTLDATFALAAAGVDFDGVETNGNTVLDYIESQHAAYAVNTGHTAKLVLGLIVAGENPQNFDGVNYVAQMESYFNIATGAYGDSSFDHAVYMLARDGLDESPAAGSVAFLRSKQLGNGGWEYGDTWGADTNTTAVAIQALIDSGVDEDDEAIQDALDYLAAAQNADAGFPYTPGTAFSDSDANSTAFVIQALVAAHENIDAGGPWEKSGTTPMEALLSFQNPNGAFAYMQVPDDNGGNDDSNAYATYQAVPALLLSTYAEPAEATATPRPSRTPTESPDGTITATPTTAPAATSTPVVTELPQLVAPASTPSSAALPLLLPSSGSGGADGGSAAIVATIALLASGTLAGGALMLRRARRA